MKFGVSSVRHLKIKQLLCNHKYETFKRPIDRENNPYGFVALNDIEPTIQVCVKCGKRID